MKQLIRRLTQRAGASGAGGGEDSTFFSTQFQDRADEGPSLATWQARALEVGALPFDAERGAEIFARLWGADRYVAALSTESLERMSGYLQFVRVAPEREVIVQDELGDFMLIVLEGRLAVDRVQPWGARARLAEAVPGDMLGEMSLLDAGTRFSTCTTLSACTLAVVDARQLDAMITAEPRLGAALLASLSRRLSLRLRQTSARLSALLSRG